MKKIFLFLILFEFLIVIPIVFSLGVSPGIVEIDFKPNLSTSFEMTVSNTPQASREVEIHSNLRILDKDIINEFTKIISFEETKFSFTENETYKKLKISLNFPEGFSKKGTHELRVGARPFVKGGEGLAVRAGNEIRILVNVPREYVDEKYAIKKELKILEIIADSVKKGENSNIKIFIKSESKITLNDIYAIIKILKDGNELASLETEKISIGPGEEKILQSVFNVGGNSGVLTLNVEVFYDSDSVKGDGSLNIIEVSEDGIKIVKKDNKSLWLWILLVILLLILIFFILFLLWKRRKEDKQEQQFQRQVELQ